MSVPVSVNHPQRFTPQHQRDQSPPPVYLLKVPSDIERIEWHRALIEAGAQSVKDDVFFAAVRAGVQALDLGEAAGPLLDTLDTWESLDPSQRAATPLLGGEVDRLIAQVARHDPDLRRMLGDRFHAQAIMGPIALRMFLKGWENGPGPFDARHGQATADTLARLDDRTREAIGTKILSLMFVGQVLEKNSASSSPSVASPEPSGEIDQATAEQDGLSTGNITIETPPT